MNANTIIMNKNQKDDHSLMAEVATMEKQLWSLVNSKGLLHSDVQNLYHQVCSCYEKIFLKDEEFQQLQEVEYSLWKLHYRHIDEFRKRINNASANMGSGNFSVQNVSNNPLSTDGHLEGFKSFLSEASNFYKSLIAKVRTHNGLPEDTASSKNGRVVDYVDPKKMPNCQFLCHCFLICLGDLARYREQYERREVQDCNWSVAATYYMDASMIWPDSGNPHNKLALLARYVGDSFLALYHCVRSLAVKEPFPDAWNNLTVSLETSMSSPLYSNTSTASFDFLKPSQRSKMTDSGVNKQDNGCSVGIEWHPFVRMISYFYVVSSLEEFPKAFSSALRELEVLMELNDMEIEDALKSYRFMNLSRRGPLRAIEFVSVLIFVIHDLAKSPTIRNLEDKDEIQRLHYAVAATFILIGRLVDRSLKTIVLESSPFIPALLVFTEWLVSMLGEMELWMVDDKAKAAVSYFFESLVCLLNMLSDKVEGGNQDFALWEDYELRGFAAAAPAQASLDFSSPLVHANSFQTGNASRVHRILIAAMKIAKGLNTSCKWISYDETRKRFYIKASDDVVEREGLGKAGSTTSALAQEHPQQCIEKANKDGENQRSTFLQAKPTVSEEEEVILFKPLTRYNSAPLDKCIKSSGQAQEEGTSDQMAHSEDCLRRATSLLAQSETPNESFSFHPNSNGFGHIKPFKPPEPLSKDTFAHSFLDIPKSSGPPSLNAWVLDGGSLSAHKDNGGNVIKHSLSPIDERTTASLADLSVNQPTKKENPITSSHNSIITHYPLPYLAPVPSAPLIPDDAVWMNGAKSTFADSNIAGLVNPTSNFLATSQECTYAHWGTSPAQHVSIPGISGLMDVYPLPRMLTSSEWLRQFREINNLQQGNDQLHSPNLCTPGNPGDVHSLGPSRYDLFGQRQAALPPNQIPNYTPLYFGFPTYHGVEEPQQERAFYGYTRQNPYGCGIATDVKDDQQVLLQYLKESEWKLQQDPNLPLQGQGRTFLGN